LGDKKRNSQEALSFLELATATPMKICLASALFLIVKIWNIFWAGT